MSEVRLTGLAPGLVRGLAQAWDTVVAFVGDLRQPAGAVAFGSCLFILISAGFVLTLERGIRAFPPPPPTRLQMRNVEDISKAFPPAQPAQRPQADR